MSPAAFQARQTAVSVAINAALSAGFCWLVFGALASVPVWGRHGLVADYLPQGFMIGLMGALVPGLLARKARAADLVRQVGAGLPSARPAPVRRVILRALATGVVGAALAIATAATVFAAGHVEALPFASVFAIKVASGMILALIATPPAVRAALA